MENTSEDVVGYQVLVCNIFWDSKEVRKQHSKIENELPNEIALNIPNNVLTQANKKGNNFNDIIESFIYNLLYRKFNHEVNECQIILPSEVATEEM